MSQVNLSTSAEHALWYLAKADGIPHRIEGEAVGLLEECPKMLNEFWISATGDGPFLGLLQCDQPNVQCVAIDFSPTMLEKARIRFADDQNASDY